MAKAVMDMVLRKHPRYVLSSYSSSIGEILWDVNIEVYGVWKDM